MLKLLWQAYTHTTTYLNTVFACTTKILLCICTLFCLIGERVDYYLYVTDWVMYVVVLSTLKVVCSYTTTELLGLPL